MSENLPAKREPLQPQRPQLTSNRKLTELTVDEMVRVSTAFARSQTFKNKGNSMTPEQIFVIILAGQELGLGPSQAVMGIKMIEGKPELSANTMAALVKASGKYDYRVAYGADDDPWCEITFFLTADGSAVGVSRFSKQDATTAGLWRNNYLKFWRNMLFARALSNGAKWYTPDALMVSAYHEGEIEGDAEAPPPPVEHQAVTSPQTTIERPGITVDASPETIARNHVPEHNPDEEQVPEEDVSVMEILTEDLNDPGASEPGYESNPLDFDPVTEPPPPIVEPPSPVVTSDEQVRTATPAQIKLMRVRQKSVGLTDERWHKILREIAGVDHTDRTPFNKVDALLERLQQEATLND